MTGGILFSVEIVSCLYTYYKLNLLKAQIKQKTRRPFKRAPDFIVKVNLTNLLSFDSF